MTTSDDEPLTLWLRQLKSGERESTGPLWQAYYRKLVAIARQRLKGRQTLIGNEEDVALSAFNSFCHAVENGRFPDLEDRDGLWKLLASITLNKTLKLIRNETRQKRGGGLKRMDGNALSEIDFLQRIADSEPSPELAILFADQLNQLMSQLDSAELVELATLKMEGYTNSEIAMRWNKAERTVERKLALIRQIWTN